MKRFFSIFWIFAVLTLGGTLLSGGCSDADNQVDDRPEPESNFVIVLIDDLYTVDYAGPMTIRGLKFAEGDAIFFKQGDRAQTVGGEEFPVEVAKITPTDITVTITPEIVSGVWSLYCRRGEEIQYLGTTTLEVGEFELVHNVVVEAAYALDRGDAVTIAGEGFTQADKIYLSQTGAETPYYIPVSAVTDQAITFRLTSDITSGAWNISCERGEETQLLGTTILTVSPFPWIDPASLPEGTNAYGRVYSGSEALAGVYVSDGVQIVRTDAQGVYSMTSERYNGTLFVSVPSGYEAPADGCVPQFYALFEDGRDRYDFPLTKADNDSYVLLVTADIQVDNDYRKMVATQTSLQSCEKSFVPAFRETLASLAGRKVYSVSLGDMVYDKFWYTRKFGIPEYKELISQFGIPFYHIMGNHDNDPYSADDYRAERVYKEELGPTYYSLNIGKVHYVALDNIRYINTGASEGVVGETNYTVGLTDRQMAWLQADLATVEDKSAPVIVWMHAPLTNCRVLEPTANTGFAGYAAFASCFDGFSDVLVLSGHWHNNHHAVYPGKPHIVEHNMGSVCGALWYNVRGYNGDGQRFGAATDGTPQGFGIYEIDGTGIRWKYRGCDVGPDVQFTAWDMNQLDAGWKDRSVENEILVNVWNWDASWKVEVLENGKPLEVTREMRKDPDYLRFVEEVYLPSGDSPSKGAAKAQATPHMFSAVTAEASTPVLIKVTDRFGGVYTEQLR